MNETLTALFSGQIPADLYHFPSHIGARAIARQAAGHGWRTFRLNGREIESKPAFLGACATAMNFPNYFGSNWDALEDSLRDLSWAPAERGYLVIYDAAQPFASAQPHEYAIALDILRNAVEYWRRTSTPMVVLVRGGQDHNVAALPA